MQPIQPISMKLKIQYFAVSVDFLTNGTFYRVSKFGITRFINGDFMGFVDKLPDRKLVEFTSTDASKMIPACCK